MTIIEFEKMAEEVKRNMLAEYVDIKNDYASLVRIGILSTIDNLKTKVRAQLTLEEDDLK